MNERERTIKSRKIRTLGEKENHKYLGIFKVDTIKLAEIKEKLNRTSQKNEKTTRNQN